MNVENKISLWEILILLGNFCEPFFGRKTFYPPLNKVLILRDCNNENIVNEYSSDWLSQKIESTHLENKYGKKNYCNYVISCYKIKLKHKCTRKMTVQSEMFIYCSSFFPKGQWLNLIGKVFLYFFDKYFQCLNLVLCSQSTLDGDKVLLKDNNFKLKREKLTLFQK